MHCVMMQRHEHEVVIINISFKYLLMFKLLYAGAVKDFLVAAYKNVYFNPNHDRFSNSDHIVFVPNPNQNTRGTKGTTAA